MGKIKPLRDCLGILYKTNKDLPEEYFGDLVKTLAELEDNECFRTKKFPHTQLHKIKAVGKKVGDIYECYIHKTSGWRFQVQYNDGFIELLNISCPAEHDRVDKVVKSKKNKF